MANKAGSYNKVSILECDFGAQSRVCTFPCQRLTDALTPLRTSAHDSGLWRGANPFQIAGLHRLIYHRLMPAHWLPCSCPADADHGEDLPTGGSSCRDTVPSKDAMCSRIVMLP
jgi:hypothetical protein